MSSASLSWQTVQAKYSLTKCLVGFKDENLQAFFWKEKGDNVILGLLGQVLDRAARQLAQNSTPPARSFTIGLENLQKVPEVAVFKDEMTKVKEIVTRFVEQLNAKAIVMKGGSPQEMWANLALQTYRFAYLQLGFTEEKMLTGEEALQPCWQYAFLKAGNELAKTFAIKNKDKDLIGQIPAHLKDCGYDLVVEPTERCLVVYFGCNLLSNQTLSPLAASHVGIYRKDGLIESKSTFSPYVYLHPISSVTPNVGKGICFYRPRTE